MARPHFDLETIEPFLDTGDLLLISGRPRLLKLFLWSEWTHVGLLWRHPFTGELYVWEANLATASNPQKDELTGVFKDGTQLVSLREKLSFYNGEDGLYAAVRRLERNRPAHELSLKMIPLMWAMVHYPFEVTYHRFILLWASIAAESLLPDRLFLSAHRAGVICSEAVAWMLQALGILQRERICNRFSPPDFSTGRPRLIMEPGWRYGPEEEIGLHFSCATARDLQVNDREEKAKKNCPFSKQCSKGTRLCNR